LSAPKGPNSGGTGRGGTGKGGAGNGGKGGGERSLRKRLTVSKRRKASSRQWLERQLNDPYVRKAKSEGYASRAAYKLREIDDRHSLLKKGALVIDLGAAPGGWTQVAVERTGATTRADGASDVVGIDYLEMAPVAGAAILLMDFLDAAAPEKLIEALGGRRPDVVLSDMAAPTTGHRRTDHLRTMGLVEAALDFAIQVLKPGGHFLAKTFQGGTEAELLARMKRCFSSVQHVKPPASRAESVELYLLAKGFRGQGEEAEDREKSD
jgi:23S rRNA (uridine2552-2'-O)-methyltransferase